MTKHDPLDPEDIETVLRSRSDGPSGVGAYVLTVCEGEGKGGAIAIDESTATPILVGQSPACQLRLFDREVSRRHASIDLDGDSLLIRDLGSTNGTFVDGVAVLAARLRGGEVVRLGSSAVRVDRVEGRRSAAPPMRDAFGRVLGSSPEMRRLYPMLDRLAASTVPIVIEGETGTGKEALAESLHEAGPRANGPFVVFDCAAVPPKRVEAELFGYEKGAFTGATSAKRGAFEQANAGTLFVDEIGELDTSVQAKLLRAIERGELRHVGSDKTIRVSVRVIAATRRDLDRDVQEGRFREDLFQHLAVARVELPPLRRRRGDVAMLTRRFHEELGVNPDTIPPEVLVRFERYEWPSNVRQLKNAVARRIALGDGDLPFETSETRAPPPDRTVDFLESIIAMKLPLPLARLRVVQEFERRYIDAVLAEHDGNVVHAAQASGIARRYFQILKGGRRR